MAQEVDYARVVRQHHKKTTAYLLAQRESCTTIREDEIDRIDRNLVPISPADLPSLRPSGSWMLAVILCPGDDIAPLAEWTRKLGEQDQDRARFYAHPEIDIVKTLDLWYAAGLHDPFLHIVSDWKTLHPPFGRDLNDRVYKDFRR